MDSIKALSVLDGRYRKYTDELKDIFSEFGLIKHRIYVEIQWLKFLLKGQKRGTIKTLAFWPPTVSACLLKIARLIASQRFLLLNISAIFPRF